MKGAIADPLESTISTPNNKRAAIKGSNQNFFLFKKKRNKSLTNIRYLP